MPFNGSAPDLGCYESDFVNPTPVKLVSFSASTQKDVVTLNWNTASEINNKGWEVQRTTNPEEALWTTLAFVDGNNNGIQNNRYSYNNKNVSCAVYYYRLKQFDFDGTTNYSNVITVNLQSNDLQLSAYPNPFGISTYITYTLAKKEKININLYNSAGELVETIANEIQQPGNYHQLLSSKALPNGTYYLSLFVGDKKSNLLLIKK